jgi:hypothetical protein
MTYFYGVPRWCLALIILLPIAGCGGGDGDGEAFPGQPAGTSPSISNLTVSPLSALQNEGGGSITVRISVDFVDQEGDVDYMGVNVLDSSGSILYVRGAPLPQFVGELSGTAQADVAINTDVVGQFALRVWLVDQTIRSSNRLNVQFSVI